MPTSPSSAPGSRPFGTRRPRRASPTCFHADATWNHRNDDRLGGIHHGSDGIVAFLAESGAADGRHAARRAASRSWPTAQGHVAVLMRVSGTRPDGRTFDDPQILLFTVEDGRVRTVDQFVGDPAAVTAFWAYGLTTGPVCTASSALAGMVLRPLRSSSFQPRSTTPRDVHARRAGVVGHQRAVGLQRLGDRAAPGRAGR